ncbi:hypothetical protein SAMN05444920_110111 [Nonomuraea solani]|uniref:Carboxypeptidase regulatory-like domain-containing protein n=1 Tax=Nonomuraea solani TaxID=1144553 RepID=A0A1H6EG40_9ACTN|nr:hypothetical protein [Nonomuraea solani]SEG96798.1 hypothetical protein SAMN05444920_110111 [Nonomuraea solani]
MNTAEGSNPPHLTPEDQLLAEEIADVYRIVDPVPATLVERLQFALALEAWESPEFEILRMQEEAVLPAGVRGGEDSRTITFDSEILTIMISVSARDEYAVRVDGWLAPPGDHLVELRTGEGAHTVRADDQGRFVLDVVPRGLSQLVVRQGLDDPAQATILAVTPSLIL